MQQRVQLFRGERSGLVFYRPEIELLEQRSLLSNFPPTSFLLTPQPDAVILAMHIHAHLQILVDGQPLTIPAGIGLTPTGFLPMHTHDTSGLIHMESPVVYDFTLQDFFVVWSQTPQGQEVATALLLPNVLVLDNGAVASLQQPLILHDHDQIVIDILLPNPDPTTAKNELFVRQIYADFLGRSVDRGGLVLMTTALDQGFTRSQAVGLLEGSPEYFARRVGQLYLDLLHRPADAAGLSAFEAFLQKGGTLDQVEAAILGSPELFNDAGGTSTGFLGALYHDLLQRDLDDTGKNVWLSVLAGGATNQQVAYAILTSPEAERDRIELFYQIYLHRPADPDGLAAFLAEWRRGSTQADILAQLAGSPEYFNQL
jgi:hypothetical protein